MNEITAPIPAPHACRGDPSHPIPKPLSGGPVADNLESKFLSGMKVRLLLETLLAFSLPALVQTMTGQAVTNNVIEQKLDQIVFPRFDTSKMSVSEAFAFMNEESRKLDPEGKGVAISITPESEKAAGAAHLGITVLNLRQIPIS